MKILVLAKLKDSQIRYKLEPLLASPIVNQVFVIRKYIGPELSKLQYITLPSFLSLRFIFLIIYPFLSIYYAKKLKVDLIIGYHFIPHGLVAHITSLVTNVKFIYAQIDMDIQQLYYNIFFGLLIRRMIRRAHFILVPGSESQKFWVKNGVNSDKVIILHSTIDTATKFVPKKTEFHYDLLYIGTLDDNKRIMFLLEVFYEIYCLDSSLKFVIVGYGPNEQKVKKYITKHKLKNNLIFMGRDENILDKLHSSKIFIMASEKEGLPCAIMEAMACGKLVFSTLAGDLADIVVEGRTGFVINELDAKLLAQSIITVLNNYDDYFLIQKNARELIVAKHSYDYATNLWNNLLRGHQ